MPVKLQEFYFEMEDVRDSTERLLKKYGLDDYEIYIRAADEEEEKEYKEDGADVFTHFDPERKYLEIAFIDDEDDWVEDPDRFADVHIIDTLLQYLQEY